MVQKVPFIRFVRRTFHFEGNKNPFVVNEHFTLSNKEFKIAYLGQNFKKFFCHQIILPHKGYSLSGHELRKKSTDVDILSNIITPNLISLVCLWEVIKNQPNKDSSGILLCDGRTNICYIPLGHSTDTFCTVGAFLKTNGWHFHAYQVFYGQKAREWFAGNQILLPDYEFL